jgi:hypothetical protein
MKNLMVGLGIFSALAFAGTSWSHSVSGSGCGSSESLARSQAESGCNMQKSSEYSRCTSEGGSPMGFGCNAFCTGSQHYWSCSARGTVNCTIIND